MKNITEKLKQKPLSKTITYGHLAFKNPSLLIPKAFILGIYEMC